MRKPRVWLEGAERPGVPGLLLCAPRRFLPKMQNEPLGDGRKSVEEEMRASSVPIPPGPRKPGRSGVSSLAAIRDEVGEGRGSGAAAPLVTYGAVAGRPASGDTHLFCELRRVWRPDGSGAKSRTLPLSPQSRSPGTGTAWLPRIFWSARIHEPRACPPKRWRAAMGPG